MFDQLKAIMQPGERYIIVEDGKPQYVIMRYTDYAILTSVRKFEEGGVTRDLDRINADFSAARTPPAAAGTDFVPTEPLDLPVDPRSIRLEDLSL
jgi:hypothetical protein